jgi:hypothetical protein
MEERKKRWERGGRRGERREEQRDGEEEEEKERKTIEQFDPRWVLSLSPSLCLQHVGMAGRVWGRVVIG